MVALSARRLVRPAISLISSTTLSTRFDASASSAMRALARSARPTAAVRDAGGMLDLAADVARDARPAWRSLAPHGWRLVAHRRHRGGGADVETGGQALQPLGAPALRLLLGGSGGRHFLGFHGV